MDGYPYLEHPAAPHDFRWPCHAVEDAWDTMSLEDQYLTNINNHNDFINKNCKYKFKKIKANKYLMQVLSLFSVYNIIWNVQEKL